MTPHRWQVRVYYEDVDLAGIVYYANYLRYIERARTEWVRSLGIDQVLMKAERGIVFAVRRVEADYLKPAHFDDVLEIETALTELGAARALLRQDVLRQGVPLFRAEVTLVALTPSGRPTRFPHEILDLQPPAGPAGAS